MTVIGICLPVLVMIVIGNTCRRLSVVTSEGVRDMKIFAVNVGLSAVVLKAFADLTYTYKSILVTAVIFIMCLASFYSGKLLKVVFREKQDYLPFLTTGFEAGMLGYAFFSLVYPDYPLSSFASIDLGQTLFAFTAFQMLISVQETGKRIPAKKMVAQMFHSPVFLAVLGGIFLGVTGIYKALEHSGITGLFNTCVDFVSAPVAAVILFTIGFNLVLSEISFSAVFKTVAARIIIVIVMRILCGMAITAIGLGDELTPALNLLFILAPPYALQAFVKSEEPQTYISSVLSVYTVLSVIAFIVLAAVRG